MIPIILIYVIIAAAVSVSLGRYLEITYRWRQYRDEVVAWRKAWLHDIDDVEPEPVSAMIAADVMMLSMVGLAWPMIFVAGGIIAAIGIAIEVTDV